MPENLGYFRRSLEKRRFSLIAGLVSSCKTPPGLPEDCGGEIHELPVRCVLDVGCGSGWLSEMLSNRGFLVTALDIGLDSISRASARIKVQAVDISFVLGDIYKLPYSESSFDAVVASEVLEHLEKPRDALKEIARIVRPGGCIVVSTPYRERIEETLCVHCNKKTPVNAHLHSFDETIMEHMLREAGFIVQKYVTFVNRPVERLGMAGLTFFLPFVVWRFLDAVTCGLFGRESFMAVRAVRRD